MSSTYAGQGRPRQSERLDKLPPHSEEAEQAVLGCILFDPENLRMAEERISGEARVFYDPRHQRLYQALTAMYREGRAIDLITVTQWLKDHNTLGEAGGLPYVAALPDIGAGTNLKSYLDILWEKYLGRLIIQDSTMLASRVMESGGVTEPLLEAKRRQDEEFLKLQNRGDITPQFLKTAGDFDEGFFHKFFGGAAAKEPGCTLPIAFPMRVRRKEMTLMSGDNGSGKSTFLNYAALHLAQQGEKVLIASLEMQPAVILWILASQLIGTQRLPDSEAGRRRALDALVWLNSRFLFYDFTGIADWRDLLDTFSYAAKNKGMTCAILDSVMRIGIPDDDYAQQGLAAARFPQAAKDGDYHLFLVIHENKGDGKGKNRIRGSKQWSDNADNVLVTERNEEKGEKGDKLAWEIEKEKQQAKPDHEVIQEKQGRLDAMRKDWDTQLILRKQRWPGTRQNGSKRFWFDPNSFQFRDHWEDCAVDWLKQWTVIP